VPVAQDGLASLQIGRHVPLLPAADPVGTMQLSPARHPEQPVSPLQPEFCVHVAPTPPAPAHAQSVVSPV